MVADLHIIAIIMRLRCEIVTLRKHCLFALWTQTQRHRLVVWPVADSSTQHSKFKAGIKHLSCQQKTACDVHQSYPLPVLEEVSF